MPFLPKGRLLRENIAAQGLNVPEMLAQMKEDGFTGYAGFVFPGAEGVFVFDEGKMIAASFRKGAVAMSGKEALEAVFGSIFSMGGTINLYRLSHELTVFLHSFVHGETVWRGKEIRFLDMKSLLSGMKGRNFSGALRVSVGERTSLIFYRDGVPLGFFHDGSETVEKTVAETQRIPGMREAKVDIVSTKASEKIRIRDLLETVDVAGVWKESAGAPAGGRA